MCSSDLTVTAAVTTTETVQAAIQYPGRPPNDRDADATLKPSETIPFLGLKPGQIVTDFIPGSGYYTRIFSRVVGPKGHVYSFVPVLGELMSERRQQMQDTKAGANPPLIPIDIILGIENIFEYSQNVSALWAQLTQYGDRKSTRLNSSH